MQDCSCCTVTQFIIVYVCIYILFLCLCLCRHRHRLRQAQVKTAACVCPSVCVCVGMCPRVATCDLTSRQSNWRLSPLMIQVPLSLMPASFLCVYVCSYRPHCYHVDMYRICQPPKFSACSRSCQCSLYHPHRTSSDFCAPTAIHPFIFTSYALLQKSLSALKEDFSTV